MNVLLFGATGMVGQGVLRECLQDARVQLAQTVGRTATGAHHSKLREIVHSDMWRYKTIEADLTGFDACFFRLGVSSGGMREEEKVIQSEYWRARTSEPLLLERDGSFAVIQLGKPIVSAFACHAPFEAGGSSLAHSS